MMWTGRTSAAVFLGVPYVMNEAHPPAPSLYGDMVRRISAGLDLKLAFEPGRLIVANAGILVAKAVYVKEALPRFPGAGCGDERPHPAGDVRGTP